VVVRVKPDPADPTRSPSPTGRATVRAGSSGNRMGAAPGTGLRPDRRAVLRRRSLPRHRPGRCLPRQSDGNRDPFPWA